MGPAGQPVNADNLLSLAEGRPGEGGACQVMDESHICFIHCRGASCYNNSGGSEKMRGSLPREARTTRRGNVNDAGSPQSLQIPGSGAGQEALTGNLLPSSSLVLPLDKWVTVKGFSPAACVWAVFFFLQKPSAAPLNRYIFLNSYNFSSEKCTCHSPCPVD